MKVAVVLGTRPEIIKMSPVIRELERRGVDHFVLHTGQHYSYSMDKVFFEVLGIRPPKHNLGIGSGTHGEETGRMLIGIERVLMEERPDCVLVEGDTNTVLAGALAASKLRIKVGHVEAGLRSGDMSMPEEINRVVTDHISDILFAPTNASMQNLMREGISDAKVMVTGNTIVDAVLQNISIAGGRDIRSEMGLGRYFLATVHRQENVDSPGRLKSIMEGLSMAAERLNRQVVYPAHPRAMKRIREFGISPGSGIIMTDPVDYITFLLLERQADLILTDSGGVQEEACILGVPCVTLRDNTERPETVEVGANVLAGASPSSIVEKAEIMLLRDRRWENPYGDGRASERIVSALAP